MPVSMLMIESPPGYYKIHRYNVQIHNTYLYENVGKVSFRMLDVNILHMGIYWKICETFYFSAWATMLVIKDNPISIYTFVF